MSNISTESRKFSGYRVAIACFIVMFMNMGALGTFGVFLAPIAQGNGFEIGALGIMLTFATGAAAIIGLFFAAPLIKKIGPKNCLIIAGISIPLHYFIYSVGNQLWHYYLGAAIGGSMIVLGTTAVISNIIGQWFIEKRASVLGIVIGGSSIGTALWMSIAGYLMTLYGYRSSYQILAVAVLIISLGTTILFITTPEKVGQKALGADGTASLGGTSTGNAAISGLSFQEVLKTSSFYLIFIGIFVSGLCFIGVKSYTAALLKSYGYTVIQASNSAAIMALIGGAAMIAGGFIAQKFGSKIYLTIILLSLLTSGLVYGVTGSNIGGATLYIALLFAGLSFPIAYSMVPTVTAEVFGNKDYGKIIIYLLSAIYVGQALTGLIVAALLPAGVSLSTIFLFFGIGGFLGFGLIVAGFATSPYLRQKKAQTANLN